jgi:hypothetical protein
MMLEVGVEPFSAEGKTALETQFRLFTGRAKMPRC